MNIEINNCTTSRIPTTLLKTVIKKFLLSRRLASREVSLVLVGDVLMRRLNRERRGQDKVTDVLSFREADTASVQPHYLGEVIIDYRQIKRQAKIFQTSVKQELIFILVHGLLHLVGYDDKTAKEAKIMENLANEIISKLS